MAVTIVFSAWLVSGFVWGLVAEKECLLNHDSQG